MKKSLPRIAITMGDPTGIGPEIVLKAISTPEVLSLCKPVILGDEGVLRETAKISECGMRNADFKIINLSKLNPQTIRPGKPDRACGEAMVTYIKTGVRMALNGEVTALVTAPINKEAVSRSGFPFSGHTEFIADLTDVEEFCMMLASDKLRVSLVTTHSPLKDVPTLISKDKVLKTIMLTYRAMIDLFGITSPRIAVASLNPHGGEKGLFGEEEESIILPAVKESVRLGVNAEGPFPPDTLFYRTQEGLFDAVVAMYHDQGLIPIKLLSFKRSVNITLGLPIIRTSVDHGTAYDIVGKGIADPSSLIYAIEKAVEMVGRKSERKESLRVTATNYE